MAIVKRCDICGVIYETHTKNTARLHIYDGTHNFSLDNTEFDCCPECTQKLLGFVDVIRKYPDNHCITVFDNNSSEHTAN